MSLYFVPSLLYMKKLLLLLLCVPLIGLGQTEYVKEYYENGKLLCEGTHMNGQKTGLHKTYYNNGLIKNKGEYLNGTKVGIWRDYNNNGDLKNEVKHLFKVDPIDDECPLPILKKKIIIE